MTKMKKKTKKRLKLIIGSTAAIFFGGIAWTNEAVDYASKIGFQNVNPLWTFFISVIAFIALTLWVVLEWKFN